MNLAAARVGDSIEHSVRLLGFAIGALVGAVAAVAIAVAVASTGGLALVAIAAGSAAVGGAVGELIAWLGGWSIETGKLTQGSKSVLINNRPAIAVLSVAEPCWIPIVYAHGPQQVIEGSGTVYIGCAPMSRVGDALLCDATIAQGSPDVQIGGPRHRVNGTEKGALDFLLPRFGFVVTATTIAIYPAPSISSMLAIGGYEANYDFYSGVNQGIGDALGVDPKYVAIGVEFGLGLLSGTAAGSIPKVGSWNALNAAAINRSWQTYVARKAAEGAPRWDYSRWVQRWHQLNGKDGVRIFATQTQKMNRIMTALLSAGGVEVGTPDLLGLISSVLQAVTEDEPEAPTDETGACDHSWHSPVES